MCFPSFHLMELFKLYVCKTLCVNLFVQESLYCQTFYTIFLSLCMIKFLSNLVFTKELCAIHSFFFASNFLHKNKQVGGWGEGGGVCVWKILQAHQWATFHTTRAPSNLYVNFIEPLVGMFKMYC